MAQEATVQFSLTKYGEQLLLKQGASNTIVKYSVMDDGQRYDVTATPNLQDTFGGGLRTLVTPIPTCRMATTESVSKQKPTTLQNKQDKMQLSWEVEKSDCSNPYTALNPNIKVHLKRWFNYLTSKLGVENYNYNDRINLTIFDNVKAIKSELNSSNYTYEQVSTFNSENISYMLDTPKSCENYLNFNAYLIKIKSGIKSLQDNTNRKDASPFLLAFDSEQNQQGYGDILKLAMTPISAGYVVKLADSKDLTYYRADFKSISFIENMTEDEINKKYKSIRPAFITSNDGSNDSVFYLTDLNGTYAEGVDVLPTYAYGFKNSNGKALLQGLIEKAENLIQRQFTEIAINQYQQTIGLRIANEVVGGDKYSKENTVGGNIKITLDWTSTDVIDDYDQIIEWI